MRYQVTLLFTPLHECNCEFCECHSETEHRTIYLERESRQEVDQISEDEWFELAAPDSDAYEASVLSILPFPRRLNIPSEEMVF